jgi:acyl-CoA synthetase (AMP-forming)/AMP-acid ligase II
MMRPNEVPMQSLMMDFPLTLDVVLRRAETLFPARPIVSRRADRSLSRTTWGEVGRRARRLAAALAASGVRPGDRVGTLAWNHSRHLEAYFGIPLCGAVLHTLNLRLHPSELEYIIAHGGDRAILVDQSLLPLLDRVHPSLRDVQLIVMGEGEEAPPAGMTDYEAFLESLGSPGWEPPTLAETDAAAMCYTTGTTGAPKGVLYSHRSMVLHSFVLGLADTFGLSERDMCLPVVPMFHVNAWGLPYGAALFGAGLAMPGPHLDPESLLDLFASAGVTFGAGVPTIWLGVLRAIDAHPGRWDLSRLKGLAVGGAAAPPGLIEGFDRHDIRIVHAWGMTETSPIGTVSRVPPDLEHEAADTQLGIRATQGRPAPLVEIRARDQAGLVKWDGRTLGELEVRGPWVASAYYQAPEGATAFTDDGWFGTGDVVTIDPRGFVHIQDRSKDLVKSGGEWISSIALENALMGHPAVAEAAVIAVPDLRWGERPLAVVVLAEGMRASPEELRAFLAPRVAKWWLPERFEFVQSIPRTSAGKFKKTELRARYAQSPG